MAEEWRDIPGYEGIYQVSDLGRVKRVATEHILKPRRNRWGYLQVQLSVRTNRKTWVVHRLVALTFIGPRPQGCDINHRNGIKTENHLDNLEYLSRKAHEHHTRTVLGLHDNEGEKNHAARLNESDVDRLRYLYSTGNYTGLELAELFGVSKSAIGYALSGETWSHLAAPLPARRGTKGTDNARAKLNENDVREIRKLYQTGDYSQEKLGRMFGVSDSAIQLIVTGKNWRHVT